MYIKYLSIFQLIQEYLLTMLCQLIITCFEYQESPIKKEGMTSPGIISFFNGNFVARQLICLREFYFLFLFPLENLINKCKLLGLKE